AALPAHLRDQAIGRLPLGLGPDGVMEGEEPGPVDLLRPAAHAVEVLGAEAQLIGPPAEQEDVLGRPQLQEAAVDLLEPEDGDAHPALLDLAPQLLLDLLAGDLLEPGMNDGVAGGQLFGWFLSAHAFKIQF